MRCVLAILGLLCWRATGFRAAPPPAVQDWGWPKFAAHTELRARDLIGTDGALRVRATVTVSVSSTDIARSDADACLLAAARTGAADAVRRCLRAGADAAHRDVAAGSARTPLHLACARGLTETLRVLLEAGVRPVVLHARGCGQPLTSPCFNLFGRTDDVRDALARIAAGDAASTFKTGVKELAYRRGLAATFSSKPFGGPRGVGNGGHFNFSLWRSEDEPATPDEP